MTEPVRFDGQVAVVTGSGRGLGATYARALAARGAAVIVHDAGVAPDGSGGDRGPADAVVEEIIRAGGTAAAAYEITAAAFPVMKAQGYGRFVLTTSGRAMAMDRTRPGLAAYAVGKMAQFGLMIVAAAEGEAHGIRVNAVAPAAATRVLRRAVEPGELDPEQVTPGVIFLASQRCDVSGRVLEAAGGPFDVARWSSSGDVDFGRRPVEPEVIADRWPEIEGVVRAA
jgi:NAD(P)-dependent dehydrogenase (short-subunit alcohol dehydrogenase family)